MFQTLRPGLGSAVAALAAAMPGVRIDTGREVVGLEPLPATAAPNGTGAWEVLCRDGTRAAFDRVLLAVPAPAAARILAGVAPEAARELQAIEYTAAASVYLAYHREAVPHPLDGTGYLPVSEPQGGALSACTWMSSKWPHTAPAHRVLLRCHLTSARGAAPEAMDPEELVSTARRELQAILGITAPPLFTRVYRWPQALPQYRLGHLQRVAAIEKALPPGVLVAGAAYRGVGLPDCVRQGQEAAAALGTRS